MNKKQLIEKLGDYIYDHNILSKLSSYNKDKLKDVLNDIIEEKIYHIAYNYTINEKLKLWCQMSPDTGSLPIFLTRNYEDIDNYFRDNNDSLMYAIVYGNFNNKDTFCWIGSDGNMYSSNKFEDTPFDVDDLINALFESDDTIDDKDLEYNIELYKSINDDE